MNPTKVYQIIATGEGVFGHVRKNNGILHATQEMAEDAVPRFVAAICDATGTHQVDPLEESSVRTIVKEMEVIPPPGGSVLILNEAQTKYLRVLLDVDAIEILKHIGSLENKDPGLDKELKAVLTTSREIRFLLGVKNERQGEVAAKGS
jgi:hypothetical protein